MPANSLNQWINSNYLITGVNAAYQVLMHRQSWTVSHIACVYLNIQSWIRFQLYYASTFIRSRATGTHKMQMNQSKNCFNRFLSNVKSHWSVSKFFLTNIYRNRSFPWINKKANKVNVCAQLPNDALNSSKNKEQKSVYKWCEMNKNE